MPAPLDVLGVEPGRISGSLARLLALLAAVAPYPLAARVAWLLLGVAINSFTDELPRGAFESRRTLDLPAAR